MVRTLFYEYDEKNVKPLIKEGGEGGCSSQKDSMYSQSPPPADFSSAYGFLGLEISIATAESGWGRGFAYIFSLFTYESRIALFRLHLINI